MVVGKPLGNLPWQDKPADCLEVVWRYSHNPVIGRHPIPCGFSAYNSAIISFEGRFVGVFRVDHKTRMPHLHVGNSTDGLKWEIHPDPIRFVGTDPDIMTREYSYDPRLTKIGEDYYLQWCNGYHGPTVGLARTRDFVEFEQMENAFLPFNRNGAPLPAKDRPAICHALAPSDNGHTKFGDIFYSESPDLVFWGKHRHVMSPKGTWWQDTKVGAGPSPIETSQGWVLFYHGVLNSCNGFIYSTGVALLDLEKPWKVLYRSKEHILTPEMPYETTGAVPNVVFPTAALCDAPTGRVALYCGAADTYTTLAFTNLFELIPWLKRHSQV